MAQIDHLQMNRFLDVRVGESKHFSEGVAINDLAKFAAFFARRPYGVPLPLEQNRKHVAVLQALFASNIVQLPTRLGMRIARNIRSVVLVSHGARISRPKTKVDGIDRVIKSDQRRSFIERGTDQASVTDILVSTTKIVSSETLDAPARQIAHLHRPIQIKRAAKFGIDDAVCKPVPNEMPVRMQTSAALPPSRVPEQTMTPPSVPAGTAETPRLAVLAAPESEKLSTSKLAAKRGLKTAGQMFERLTELGYLEPQGGQLQLTTRGQAAGAVFIEKSWYGPYFMWPIELRLDR